MNSLLIVLLIHIIVFILMALICYTNSKSIKHLTGSSLSKFGESIGITRIYHGALEPKLNKAEYFYDEVFLPYGLPGFYESDHALRKRIAQSLKVDCNG